MNLLALTAAATEAVAESATDTALILHKPFTQAELAEKLALVIRQAPGGGSRNQQISRFIRHFREGPHSTDWASASAWLMVRP